MKLSDYLAEQNIRRTEFADLIGVSQSYITQLCKGQIWPGRDIAGRIIEVTGGAVTANDFVIPASGEAA